MPLRGTSRHHGGLFHAAAFIISICGLLACDSEPAEGGTVIASDSSRLRINKGTITTVGGCRVGVSAVVAPDDVSPYATMTVVSPQNAREKSFVNVKARKEDVVVICGGYHRVLEVVSGGAPAAILDRSAVRPASPSAGSPPDSLAVTPGAVARFVSPTGEPITPRSSAELISISKASDGKLTATFDTWGEGYDKPSTSKRIEVGAGGELVIEGRRYKVGAVVEADPGKKLPGFVEISPAPLP
jgi:hypothetical protein